MIPLLGLIALVAGITGCVYFDKIVRLEYMTHKTKWEADGMPNGYFWNPDEYRQMSTSWQKLTSNIARCRCEWSWLFSAPAWAKDDETLKQQLLMWRVCCVTMCLAAGTFVIANLFSGGFAHK